MACRLQSLRPLLRPQCLSRHRICRMIPQQPYLRHVSRFSTYYSSQHEYLHVLDNQQAKIGITDFAQNQLGDVVYVDLPSVGETFEKGSIFGSVESVKAASDIYLPVDGEVVEINEALVDSPNLVNESPMEDGWFIKIKVTNAEESFQDLMDESAYATHCEESKDH